MAKKRQRTNRENTAEIRQDHLYGRLRISYGMRNLPFGERLRKLNTLTLAHRRIYADMIFTYKCIYEVNFPATEFGLRVKASIIRNNGYQLTQSCSNNNTCANLFSCRAASQWNKLPLDIVSSRMLSCFKQMLFKHLFASQFYLVFFTSS